MATEISFYHLTKSDLRKALPSLLEKIISSDRRAVLFAQDETKLMDVDSMLWTFSTNRFIPHGNHKEEYKADQPVYLTTEEENPNKADVLVLVDGSVPKYVSKFARIVDVFDGNNEAELKSARERWKAYKSGEYTLSYWKQNEAGGWEAQAA